MKRQFSGSVIWRRRESWSCAYVGCNSLVQNCRGGSNDKEVKALDFLNKELGILSDFICAFFVELCEDLVVLLIKLGRISEQSLLKISAFEVL